MAEKRLRTLGALISACVLVVTLNGCGAAEEKPCCGGNTPSATAKTTEPPKKAAPREATVVVSGDLLWHPTLYEGGLIDARKNGKSGYDLEPLFRDLKPVVSQADLGICHEEVPFAPEGEQTSGYPTFGAPPALAKEIKKVGWDMCTTASNHSIDRGIKGLEQTITSFNKAGIDVVGTYKDKASAEKPYIFTTKNGVKISVVMGTYGLNGLELPAGHEYAVDMLDAKKMLKRARKAKEAGADIVLAAIHGGDEYQTQPNQQQIETAKILAASEDIDLIYGHHVHVVQPWTRMNNKLVIFGLGNMIAQHLTSVPEGYEGVTAELSFIEKPGGGFKLKEANYYPTLVTKAEVKQGVPARLYQVNKALKDPSSAPATTVERLKIAKERANKAVKSMGIKGIHEK